MTKRWTPLRILAMIFLLVSVVVCVYPLLWIMMSSFKTNNDFLLHPFSLPTRITLENYVVAWKTGNFLTWFGNSIIVAVLSLIIMLGTGAMVAYAMSRYRRIGYTNKLLFFFIVGQMISGQVIIISIYLILNAYGLVNSRLGLALVYAASGLPFVVFMLSGFFKSIPFELYEAGEIDGISEWGIFTRIAVPLAKPAIATALITQFLYVWNEFTMSYIMISNSSSYTIPTGIYVTINQMYGTSYTNACAGLVITGLPPLIIYAIFQKQIIYGISSGAVKG